MLLLCMLMLVSMRWDALLLCFWCDSCGCDADICYYGNDNGTGVADVDMYSYAALPVWRGDIGCDSVVDCIGIACVRACWLIYNIRRLGRRLVDGVALR